MTDRDTSIILEALKDYQEAVCASSEALAAAADGIVTALERVGDTGCSPGFAGTLGMLAGHAYCCARICNQAMEYLGDVVKASNQTGGHRPQLKLIVCKTNKKDPGPG